MAGVPMKNLRDMDVDTGSGKDVKDTNVLKGDAKMTSAFKEKNSTTQYTTSGKCEGPWGGENANK